MEEMKKVDIEELLKENNAYENLVPREWTGKIEIWPGVETDITVKHRLGLGEAMSFVTEISKFCFLSDGTYHPELKDIALQKMIVELYSNVQLPSDASKCYEILESSNLVNLVLSQIDHRQFDVLMEAVDEKINELVEANTETVKRQMNELYETFNALQEKLAGIFSGVDEGDLAKLANALSSDKFDPEKIAKAVVSDKIKSDKVIQMKKEDE